MSANGCVIVQVVEQHAEEAGFLWMQRRHAVLYRMSRCGILRASRIGSTRTSMESGSRTRQGMRLVRMPLASGEPGPLFVATVLAVEAASAEQLERLLALGEALPQGRCGLFGAFGWSGSADLRGIVAGMLSSPNAFRRLAGTVACSMHRVDPGIISRRRLRIRTRPSVRARCALSANSAGRSSSTGFSTGSTTRSSVSVLGVLVSSAAW